MGRQRIGSPSPAGRTVVYVQLQSHLVPCQVATAAAGNLVQASRYKFIGAETFSQQSLVHRVSRPGDVFRSLQIEPETHPGGEPLELANDPAAQEKGPREPLLVWSPGVREPEARDLLEERFDTRLGSEPADQILARPEFVRDAVGETASGPDGTGARCSGHDDA